ncbi:MAG: TadE/TadG family type IV pilus assembly protein [Pirellulales bacterium]
MCRSIESRNQRCALWRARLGVVTVEFAICAPILFFIFFAALEFGRVNMIRQSVENAVYEGSRRGIVPGATADDCRTAARGVLNTVSVSGATIDVVPAVITPDTSQVTVSVTVPINNNSWVAPMFFKDKTLTNSMTLRRERFNTNSVP